MQPSRTLTVVSSHASRMKPQKIPQRVAPKARRTHRQQRLDGVLRPHRPRQYAHRAHELLPRIGLAARTGEPRDGLDLFTLAPDGDPAPLRADRTNYALFHSHLPSPAASETSTLPSPSAELLKFRCSISPGLTRRTLRLASALPDCSAVSVDAAPGARTRK